ncbi:ABC transporter substrate-binding protein [Lederbergia citri]|uniref:Extracellular solute-binding protein n=1 Tax=Lederbergia citri TaxID=2833580 RepID=A0A942TDG7_9BACI|nr:extracellular solute-binding protein [Lederbergia citri]MBS4195683.1 extracellular solute-binding protein [Lederbergia citri]
MKGFIYKTLILLLVIGLISGCSKSTNGGNKNAEDAEDKIELRMTWWGSQDRHDRTIKVIELYEKLNPNIKISPEFTGWDGYWEKLATQAAGKNLPDIIQMDYKFLSDYSDKGLLIDLNPYVDSGILNLDDVDDQYLNGGIIDDKLFAINIGANAHAVLVDPALFEKAGIPIPEPGYTWDDLKLIGQQLSDKLGDGVYGTHPNAGIMAFKHYLREHKLWLFNEDGTGLGYEDDQLLADFLQITVDMIKSGAAAPPEVFKSAGSNVEQMPIIMEQAAMQMDIHSNQIIAMESASGRPLQLILQPMLEGGEFGHYIKPGQFLSVTIHSKQAQEAAKFINFFTNDLEANRILDAERGVPISEKVREDLRNNLSDAGKKMFDYLDLVADYSREIDPPDPVGATEIEDYFAKEIEDPIYYNQISPEDAAKAFRDKATEILAKNKK